MSQEAPRSKLKKFIIRTAVGLGAIGATLALLISIRFLSVYEVPTAAMSPAINPGDYIAAEKSSVLFGGLQRGRVYCFSTEGIRGIETLAGSKPQVYIKRLVGLPGDVLLVKDKKLLINNQPVSRYFDSPVSEYFATGMKSPSDLSSAYMVPDGHAFFLGDNSRNSADSRLWGPLPIKNIRQKYLAHLKRGPVLPEGWTRPTPLPR